MVTKQKLIEKASEILGHIFMKDVYGLGYKEPCLSTTHLQKLMKWQEDLKIFTLNLENQAIGKELNSMWYYNGERVSEKMIKYAIKLLYQI